MKSKYCFVRSLGGFSLEDVVFIVNVGTDMVSRAHFDLVRLYAADCGMYFRRWSIEVDAALDSLAHSLIPGSMIARLYLKEKIVDINELYRHIIDDTLISFERSLTTPRSLRNLLAQIDPKTYFSIHRPKGEKRLQAVPRKNLKSSEREDFTKFLVGCGLILILVLLDAIVSSTWLVL